MYCQCGCGEITKVITVNHTQKNRVRGEYDRFVKGHQKRLRPGGESAVPFKIDGVYCRLIPVGDGYYVIVDESDYAWLTQWKWHKKRNRDGKVYAVRKGLLDEGFRGQQVAMHRMILGLNPGDELEGDHKNRNTLDNRRANLRPATDWVTACNADRKNSTTGYRGVTLRPNGTLRVRVTGPDGVRHSLGNFPSLDKAAQVSRRASIEFQGEFSPLGES